MKKSLMTLMAILMAATTYAVSFDWGTGTTKVSFDGTALTTASNAATGYLVLLGSAGLSGLYTIDYTAPGAINPADSVSSKATTSTGLASGKGRIAGNYSSSSIAANQVYGMYITYNDGTDTWYNFSSDTYTVSSALADDPTTTLNPGVFSFNFNTKTEITADGMTPSGWTKINIPTTPSVPEPATGALALAGVALLFRRARRKA